MALGVVGSTAWALLITVTEPAGSDIPNANPVVHMEQEEQCQSIADAINAKAYQAGVKEKLSARCDRIEYIEAPEGWLENMRKSHHETRVHH